MKARRMLWIAGLAMVALPMSRASANIEPGGKCDGRYSWLVPGACTFCEWGGKCGQCDLSGCVG